MISLSKEHSLEIKVSLKAKSNANNLGKPLNPRAKNLRSSQNTVKHTIGAWRNQALHRARVVKNGSVTNPENTRASLKQPRKQQSIRAL